MEYGAEYRGNDLNLTYALNGSKQSGYRDCDFYKGKSKRGIVSKRRDGITGGKRME